MKSFGLTLIAGLLALFAYGAQATTTSYSGLFVNDDDNKIIFFSLATPGTVTAQTWSFGGGMNAAGDLISSGGFAPTLSLFNMTLSSQFGLLLEISQSGASGSCPSGASADPATGFCWDVGMSSALQAGDYYLVLSQDSNTPLGPTYFDGFLQAGRGNFTGIDYLGQPGQCTLVDGSQRSCGWALDIALPGSTAVPLPGGLVLLTSGLVALVGLRRRNI